MANITQTNLTVIKTKFPMGIGYIGSSALLESHQVTSEQLDQFLQHLGDFYTNIDSDKDDVPSQCVDGRARSDSLYEPKYKAAAGTFSAVVGDALTNGNHCPKDGNVADHAKVVYTFLIEHGYTVGGHDADHAAAGGCGCGAEDNLERIIMFIRDNGGKIRSFLADLGIEISDEIHAHIVKRASELVTTNYIVSGEKLRNAYFETAGNSSVETLVGDHKEVVLVINSQTGSTIDRSKLAEAYNNSMQAFELDIPGLRNAANALSLTTAEAERMFIAMLYYNVATAAVLAGPSLHIAVR